MQGRFLSTCSAPTSWIALFCYHWCPASPPLSSSCKQSHWRWTPTGPPVASAPPREASASPPWQSGSTKQKFTNSAKWWQRCQWLNVFKQCHYILCPAGVGLGLCIQLNCIVQTHTTHQNCASRECTHLRVLKQTLFCYLLPFIYTGETAAFELWCELNSCTHWEGGAENRPSIMRYWWTCDVYKLNCECELTFKNFWQVVANIFPLEWTFLLWSVDNAGQVTKPVQWLVSPCDLCQLVTNLCAKRKTKNRNTTLVSLFPGLNWPYSKPWIVQ